MGASEWEEWMEFFTIYPLPTEVAEIQRAIIAFRSGMGGNAKIDDFIISGKTPKTKPKQTLGGFVKKLFF